MPTEDFCTTGKGILGSSPYGFQQSVSLLLECTETEIENAEKIASAVLSNNPKWFLYHRGDIARAV